MAKLIGPLVLTFILAGPRIAGAECAWVLWTTYGDGGLSVLSDVYLTKAECEMARGEHEQFLVDAGYRRLGRLFTSTRGGTMSFACLPDTIDPRGPKGSGR